jgi:hypothetical protein
MPFCRYFMYPIRLPESAMRGDARGYVADSGTSGEKRLRNAASVRDGRSRRQHHQSREVKTLACGDVAPQPFASVAQDRHGPRRVPVGRLFSFVESGGDECPHRSPEEGAGTGFLVFLGFAGGRLHRFEDRDGHSVLVPDTAEQRFAVFRRPVRIGATSCRWARTRCSMKPPARPTRAAVACASVE